MHLLLVPGRVPRIGLEIRRRVSLLEDHDLVQVRVHGSVQGPVHDLEAGRTHAAFVIGNDLANLPKGKKLKKRIFN